MPRGMGSPERGMFDPNKKAENKASFEAMNTKIGAGPNMDKGIVVEGNGRWGKVDRTKTPEIAVGADRVIDDEPTERVDHEEGGVDEHELEAENKENAAEALLDQWADYLIDDTQMMSESGKVLVDVQKLYDLGLTEKSLQDIRTRLITKNAPVRRDVYGQGGKKSKAA